MQNQLKVSISQYTDKGRKEINQDFHDLRIPKEPQLSNKGIAIAIADGISSSDVSQIASKVSVTSFLTDYFSTPESWTVNKSVQRVLASINSWYILKVNRVNIIMIRIEAMSVPFRG
jgi:serine/threonine protein phosphatase PrpC